MKVQGRRTDTDGQREMGGGREGGKEWVGEKWMGDSGWETEKVDGRQKGCMEES